MLLNEMWKIFEITGDIDAYLYYKEFTKITIVNDIEIEEIEISGEKLLKGF